MLSWADAGWNGGSGWDDNSTATQSFANFDGNGNSVTATLSGDSPSGGGGMPGPSVYTDNPEGCTSALRLTGAFGTNDPADFPTETITFTNAIAMNEFYVGGMTAGRNSIPERAEVSILTFINGGSPVDPNSFTYTPFNASYVDYAISGNQIFVYGISDGNNGVMAINLGGALVDEIVWQVGEVEDFNDAPNFTWTGGNSSQWITPFCFGNSNSTFTPPTPTCPAGTDVLHWTQSINPSTGDPIVELRCDGTTNFAIPPGTYPALLTSGVPVTVNISEVISYDGSPTRASQTQTNERWRLVFRKDGSTVATTGYTNDITDGVEQASWVGSLGVVSLPAGADEIIVEHWCVDNGPSGESESVSPTSICLSVSGCPDPYPLCPGESYTLTAEDGWNNYQWWYDADGVGPVAPVVVANTRIFANANQLGTYYWTAEDGSACPVEACCQIVLEEGDCCTMDVVSATPTPCDPLINTYSLDVVLNYSGSPGGNITVSTSNGGMATVACTTSPQTVTLTGLTSDGAQNISITAFFVDEPTCTDDLADAYDAPEQCDWWLSVTSCSWTTTKTGCIMPATCPWRT
ncbi:MAG: hypothetical protein H6573_00040 [Lewinellaceae bacterium]|nr:hypothetical protein [Lewinellaceae bacterium]